VSSTKGRSIQYINYLRVFAIFSVVFAHVTMWSLTTVEPLTFNWWVGNWMCLCCLWAVPVFVMVSGALLLDDSRRETALVFYKKRLSRIGIPFVFWTLFYLVVRKVFDNEGLTVGYAIRLVLAGEPHWHMWFLYMIVGLYLITPALRCFIRNSSSGERIFTIVLIFILASSYSLVDMLFWRNQRTIFTLFIPYIGYYMCGYQLRFVDPKKIPFRYLAVAAVFCAVYIALLTGEYIETGGFVNDRFVLDFFSPPVIFMSLGIFWAAFLREQKKKSRQGFAQILMRRIAVATFGIYLIHLVVLLCMREGLGKYADKGNFLAGIVIVSVVAFVLCYIIVEVIMHIPFLRRIVC
jgi:surface polysaccharide O-acyltransferase-like enzyme